MRSNDFERMFIGAVMTTVSGTFVVSNGWTLGVLSTLLDEMDIIPERFHPAMDEVQPRIVRTFYESEAVDDLFKGLARGLDGAIAVPITVKSGGWTKRIHIFENARRNYFSSNPVFELKELEWLWALAQKLQYPDAFSPVERWENGVYCDPEEPTGD